MYIEHPYFYEGKYYANIDGEMIEITKEVAYAMNNFYRSSKAKKVEIKNELGEVVDKMLREVPYSGQSIDGEGFMIEDFPDLKANTYSSVITVVPLTSRIYKKRYLPTHVFISKYDMTGIRKGSLALAEQVMSISTKCIIEKCGRVNKWSLDRVLKAVQIQMGMEGEGHDGRGI